MFITTKLVNIVFKFGMVLSNDPQLNSAKNQIMKVFQKRVISHKLLILFFVILLGCSPQLKARKSKRPPTDIIIMTCILVGVVWWCNDEGFNKHIK